MKRASMFGCLVLLVNACLAAEVPAEVRVLSAALAKAQRAKDEEKVNRLAQESLRALGARAGVPEVETRYKAASEGARGLTANELSGAFQPWLDRLEREAWWKKPIATAEMPNSLRVPASVVEGCLAAQRAGCGESKRLIKAAREGADFLLFAQEQGQARCFPFPAMRGRPGRLGDLSRRALARAAEQGRTGEMLRNGWFIEDDGNGDLQFDNGLAGVAVLRMYERTGERKFLRAALAAGDWAMAQPAVRNWNYNSFSVFLLAEMYRVTGESRYLEAAKEKARLGIYPGQIREGRYAGRWGDPHNARLVYHYILLRGLASLCGVLPETDRERGQAEGALRLGLEARNSEILEKGMAHPETVLEVMARILLEPGLARVARDTRCAEVFELLFREASLEYRRNGTPASPVAWGLALEARKRMQGSYVNSEGAREAKERTMETKQKLLKALDHAIAGQWELAHQIVQGYETDRDAAWIHAVLHRIEGDEGNAGYWYSRAGRSASGYQDPNQELEAIKKELAANG